MKVSLSISELSALSQVITKMPELQAITAFKMNKNRKRINDVLVSFDESRQEFIKKFVELDEIGNPIVENNQYKFISDEALAECDRELNAMIQFKNELELDVITFHEIEGLKLSINEMDALEPILISTPQ